MCTDSGDFFRLKLLSQEDGPQVQLTVNQLSYCTVKWQLPFGD